MQLCLIHSNTTDEKLEIILNELPKLVQILPLIEKIQLKLNYDYFTLTDIQFAQLKLLYPSDPEREIYEQLLASFKDQILASEERQNRFNYRSRNYFPPSLSLIKLPYTLIDTKRTLQLGTYFDCYERRF